MAKRIRTINTESLQTWLPTVQLVLQADWQDV